MLVSIEKNLNRGVRKLEIIGFMFIVMFRGMVISSVRIVLIVMCNRFVLMC